MGPGTLNKGTHICVLFSETNNHFRQAWQNLDVKEDIKLDKVDLCRGPDSISSKHKSPVTKDNGTLAVTPETGVQSREHKKTTDAGIQEAQQGSVGRVG